MNLIIIYGSQGVGKLTIARQFAEKSGYRLFHNHVSVDVARTLFDFGDEGFNEVVWAVRTLVFEQAAKHNMPGLIFTWLFTSRLSALSGSDQRHHIPIQRGHPFCLRYLFKRRAEETGGRRGPTSGRENTYCRRS